MPRKSNRLPRKNRRDKFQFERLEPREMFSVSGGLTLEEILASRQVVEHPVEAPGAPDAGPPVGGQADQGLDNFLFLPMVTPNRNGSVQTATPFQLGADVFVNSNVDLSVLWSKVSGPGTATFADGTKIDTTVQFDQPGTYLLKLEATNNGYHGSGLITVTVDGVLATDPIAPELFDTTYALPTGGTTHRPTNGTEFQAALNAAQSGDVIVLQAGTTYTGNFSLPKKQGDGWIYIISSKLDQLPIGERVGMDDAAQMPKLVAADEQLPVIRTEFGSHHYRLAGLEVSTDAAMNDLIRTGYGGPQGNQQQAGTLSELPHHITFDRMLIHSTSDTNRLRVGIILNGQYMAVLNSYVANVKDGPDAQAIWSWNGDGPYKIVNNFLEATGENIMFGGEDPRIANLVPSDIEVRGNHLFKRTEWISPNAWTIKNLLEFKNARHVFVVGNVLENSWVDGQSGFAIVITPRNQNNTAPWSVTEDITIEYNKIMNVGTGFLIAGEDENPTHTLGSQQTQRINIRHNILVNVSSNYYGNPRFFLLNTAKTSPKTGNPGTPIKDLAITNNLMLFDDHAPTDGTGNAAIYLETNNLIQVQNLTVKNNIWMHGTYASNIGPSNASGYSYEKNIVIMMPGDSRYAANKANFGTNHPNDLMADQGLAGVGFVNYSIQDFRLAANSAFKNMSTDGTDPGPNIDALEAAIASVKSGTSSATLDVNGSVVPSDVSVLNATSEALKTRNSGIHDEYFKYVYGLQNDVVGDNCYRDSFLSFVPTAESAGEIAKLWNERSTQGGSEETNKLIEIEDVLSDWATDRLEVNLNSCSLF